MIGKNLLKEYLKKVPNNIVESGERVAKNCSIKLIASWSHESLISVRSETSYKDFIVRIVQSGHSVESICSCPDSAKVCKHSVAAIYRMIHGDKGTLAIKKEKKVFSIPYVDEITKDYISEHFSHASKFSFFALKSVSDHMVHGEHSNYLKSHKISFVYEKKNILATCSCASDEQPCEHIASALVQLVAQKKQRLFHWLKSESSFFHSVLEEHGLTPETNNGIIQFNALQSKGLFSVSNEYLSKEGVEKLAFFSESQLSFLAHAALIGQLKDDRKSLTLSPFLLISSGTNYNVPETEVFPQIRLYVGKRNANGIHKTYVQPIADAFANGTYFISEQDALRNQTIAEYTTKRQEIINEQLQRSNDDIAYFKRCSELLGVFHKILTLTKELSFYAVKDIEDFKNKDLRAVKIYNDQVHFEIIVSEKKAHTYIDAKVKVGNETLTKSEVRKGFLSLFMLEHNSNVYVVNNYKDVFLLQHFALDKKFMLTEHYGTFYNNVLHELEKSYPIQLETATAANIKEATDIQFELYLDSITEQIISFLPVVSYNGHQIHLFSNTLHIQFYNEENELIAIPRDFNAEEDFRNTFKYIHPAFEDQFDTTFALTIDQFVSDNWFLSAFKTFQKYDVEVFGEEKLQNLQYSLASPTYAMSFSSNTDWFDVHMELSYNGESIPLNNIKKALVKKQNYVTLKSGKRGVLPTEWLKKYENLIVLGDIKKNSLQLSKFNFNVIDEIYEDIQEEESLLEIIEIKNRLLSITEVKSTAVPEQIDGTLRDYQKEGLNWLQYLYEIGMGGCLADDMGLGKTLQIITHLQSIKNQKGAVSSMVIVPTSLLYNWSAELKKFAPELTFYIHYGSTRDILDQNHLDQYDIIISTYGHILNDIVYLKDLVFDFVILDESQAIKNPNSKRYKAVRSLQAKNRITMTGTPIENNTFDLYAQFNFLNPGMFGSINNFSTQFAKEIDVHQNQDRTKFLSKMIHPFILRRTKDQVAKELPPKSESIVYCTMSNGQRKVYDAFKNKYRDYLLNKFEEEGVEKSKLFVLEGLTKLRQICDSPAILNEQEDYGNESVKIRELLHQLDEIIPHHKVLIFSSFVKMLKEVKTNLESHDVDFEYLDGQTKNRMKAVERFQTDDKCRVFLISIKAGGVGLNLTAADYVYILDPWWNPAVEAQAIDRCYRIGQDKHVFAYKMVCKDTVEEKIVKLQERKSKMVGEIIQTDESTFKNLSQDAIMDLFG